MKKLIAAAVATSVSAIAFADVSITGNANYEYFHKEDSGINTNYGDTEINLSVKGKSGDTAVVANFEVTNHGSAASTSAAALDIEDTYMTTKVGDFDIKAGNFASGTTALGGEIDQGSRSTNKTSISTKVGGATIGYHVASDSSTNDVYNTDGAAITASMDIAGVNVQVKEQSDSYTLVGVKGSAAGINYRIENWDSDTANNDVTFYEVGTKLGDLNVSYASIDADTTGLVTEGDSAIFAQEMAVDSTSTGKTGVDGVSQFTVGTTVDGTAIKLRVGELRGAATYKDAGFSRIEASRTLASGAKLTVSYDDYEDTGVTTSGTMSDTQLLEVDR